MKNINKSFRDVLNYVRFEKEISSKYIIVVFMQVSYTYRMIIHYTLRKVTYPIVSPKLLLC